MAKRASHIAADAKRALARIDRLSVKAVSIVANKVDHNGELATYDGIEAAREIRELITQIFADFSRSRFFRSTPCNADKRLALIASQPDRSGE